MTITRPLDGDRLGRVQPASPADCVELVRGAPVTAVSHTAEYVYLVVEGECHVRVDRLAGTLGEGGQVHVRRDVEHDLTSLTETARAAAVRVRLRAVCGRAAGAGGRPHAVLRPPFARLAAIR